MNQEWQDQQDRKAWQKCEVGHKRHERFVVAAEAGHIGLNMDVYNYDRYANGEGYCSGKDDISRTILNTGTWEPIETAAALNVLVGGNPFEQVVLDFGAHIGWYSLIAAKHLYNVFAYEADAENIDLLNNNAKQNAVDDKIEIVHTWVDADFPALPDDLNVRLMKVDIEGNEHYAVRAAKHLFQNKRIDYALIEVSPVFNDSYPLMVDFIKNCGYEAYVVEGIQQGRGLEKFDGNFDFNQLNLLFEAQR